MQGAAAAGPIHRLATLLIFPVAVVASLIPGCRAAPPGTTLSWRSFTFEGPDPVVVILIFHVYRRRSVRHSHTRRWSSWQRRSRRPPFVQARAALERPFLLSDHARVVPAQRSHLTLRTERWRARRVRVSLPIGYDPSFGIAYTNPTAPPKRGSQSPWEHAKSCSTHPSSRSGCWLIFEQLESRIARRGWLRALPAGGLERPGTRQRFPRRQGEQVVSPRDRGNRRYRSAEDLH